MISSSSEKIANPKQTALLLNPVNRHMVFDMIAEAKSVRELVDTTGLEFGNVYYRLRKLQKTGLIAIESETRRKGRPIKKYRAIASAFILNDLPAQDPLQAILKRICNRIEAEDAEMAGVWIGIDGEGRRLMKRIEQDGVQRKSYQICRQLYLSADDQTAMRQDLERLLTRYSQKAETSPGRAQPFTIWAGLAAGTLRDR